MKIPAVPAWIYTALRFSPFLGQVIALILFVCAMMGPSILRYPSLSLMSLGPLPNNTQVDALQTGVYLGVFASCYHLHSTELICTPTAIEPVYNATFDALSIPTSILSFVPTQLKLTPGVLISTCVILFVALPLMLIPMTSRYVAAKSPLSRISYRVVKYTYLMGSVLNFASFCLGISAVLALQEQWSTTASYYNGLAAHYSSALDNGALSFAQTGIAFRLFWAAFAFLGLQVLVSYVEWEAWPRAELPAEWNNPLAIKA